MGAAWNLQGPSGWGASSGSSRGGAARLCRAARGDISHGEKREQVYVAGEQIRGELALLLLVLLLLDRGVELLQRLEGRDRAEAMAGSKIVG